MMRSAVDCISDLGRFFDRRNTHLQLKLDVISGENSWLFVDKTERGIVRELAECMQYI